MRTPRKVGKGGDLHPWLTPGHSAKKVKPQVTTQIAHSRVRSVLAGGVEISTFPHPYETTTHGTQRVAPVRAALGVQRAETEER